MFNAGAGISPQLTTAPVITLNSPADNFATTNQTVIFNATVFSAVRSIVNVSLILNGVVNETNTSGINGSNYIFNVVLPFADYNWTYESCDNESSCTIGDNRSLSVTNFIENNVTFNAFVRETSFQDFELNISTIPTILSVSAFLNYDGARDSSTVVCDGLDCTITNDIDIPLVSTGESENKVYMESFPA